MLHYELTRQEARAAKLASGAANDWIDARDFADLPARAAPCRTGDGHAQVIRDWGRVTRPQCLAKVGRTIRAGSIGAGDTLRDAAGRAYRVSDFSPGTGSIFGHPYITDGGELGPYGRLPFTVERS